MSTDETATEMTGTDRRTFLRSVGVGAGALLVAGLPPSALAFRRLSTSPPPRGGSPLVKGGTLNIYTYPNYAIPGSLDAYRKATGTRINVSTFDSNEAAIAKLLTGGGQGFDLMIATNPFVPEMAKKQLIQKIDKHRVPWQYIDRRLLGRAFDPPNDYTIPRAYGTIGIIYDPRATGRSIHSWQDVFVLAPKSGISGKVELGSAAYEQFGIALWSLGLDWNTQSRADLKRAANKLKMLAKHVKAFNGYDVQSYVNGSAVIALTTQDAARVAIEQNKHLKWVIPRPHSELWEDNWVMVKGAPNPDQAYSFLNFILQPQRQIVETGKVGLPGPLPGLQGKLPKSFKLGNLIFIPPRDFKTLQTYVIHPSIQAYMQELFTEIQAAA